MRNMTRSLTPVTMSLRSLTKPYYLSCYSFSSSSLVPQQKIEDDAHNRNVKVLVWWDFEDCPIPEGVNAFKIANNITSALRANGIKGPVTITAFGDFLQHSRSTQEFLSATGVSLNHVPSYGRNTADRSLLTDLVFWVSQNPPPAHLFLISGDKDFASVLHRLRMNNYNILLASMDAAPGVLCSAASITWPWVDLARGESFSGKHFNTPPDGPGESWYVHKRGPLEDSFMDMAQPTSVQAENFPDAVIDSKPRTIPKILVNRIRRVVNSYPKGINISMLHSELGKNNVTIGGDYYGHKKFSTFLKSLPTVLKLQFRDDGQIFAHGIHSEVVEPTTQPKVAEPADQPKIDEPLAQLNFAEPVDKPKVAEPVDQPKVTEPIDQPKVGELVDFNMTDLKVFDDDRKKTVNAEPSASRNSAATHVADRPSLPAYSPPKPEPPFIGPDEKEVQPKDADVSHMHHTDSVSDVGFLRTTWRNVFGHNTNASDKGSDSSTEPCCTSFDSLEKKEQEEKAVSSSVSTSNSNEPVLEEKSALDAEEKDKTIPRMGMFSRMVMWFKPSKSSTFPDNSHSEEEVKKMNTQFDSTELFLKTAFWDDMLLFLQSPKGLALISQSKTREDMAQQLQTEGPPPLDTLATSDLIHLVDLLISKKNWVEESISRGFPFKLSYTVRALSSPSYLRRPIELSSMFLGNSSKSNFRGPLPSHGRDNEKNKHTPSGRSKTEILTDCQKLVAEKLKEQPEGFNVGCFKKSFRDKYGYILDHQKLGYPKLEALLQTVPGVVVEFSFVLPSARSPKSVIPYSVENVETGKDNDDGSTWEEELGPISETNSKRLNLRSEINLKTNERNGHVNFDGPNYFSDEFSDSDGESPLKDGTKGKRLTRNIEEESSLLRILDSCYNKNDKGIKDQLGNNELGESSRNNLMNSGLKRPPRKIYSFISDKVVEEEKGKLVKGNLGSADGQDNLVNGILGTLSKSPDSKLQS